MNVPKDWSAMNLQETAGWRKANDAGYAMAALLVSIGVMLLMLTAAMPVWKQAATREKEAELVFRGEQYARAIGLFGRKYGGAFPPNLDVLIEQKFLRKKYKDPITNDEFQLLYQTTQRPGGPRNPPGSAGNSGGTERQSSGGGTTVGAGGGVGAAPTGVTGAQGAVVGVTSKSKERSIKLYKGRGRYNEWQFVYTPVTQTPGDNNGRPGRDRPGAGGSRDRPGGGNPGGAGGAGGAGGGGIPRPRPGPGGPPGS
jgi:type II secretory pathway pseudopilin PulG